MLNITNLYNKMECKKKYKTLYCTYTGKIGKRKIIKCVTDQHIMKDLEVENENLIER